MNEGIQIEAKNPNQNVVSKNNVVDFNQKKDERLRRSIAEQGQKIDPSITIESTTPAAQQPPTKITELKEGKVVHVGFDPVLNDADAKQGVQIVLSPLTGKSIWARIVDGIRGHRRVEERILKKASAEPEKTDVSDIAA